MAETQNHLIKQLEVHIFIFWNNKCSLFQDAIRKVILTRKNVNSEIYITCLFVVHKNKFLKASLNLSVSRF